MRKKILSIFLSCALSVGLCSCEFIPAYNQTSGAGTSSSSQTPAKDAAELSVHFLELGNKYTGECTLIKVGDTEVLIDAGSRKSSASAIVSYVSNYCEDGVLEYVIATHAHQDHIAGFVGTTSAKGVFESFETSL